MTVVAQEVPQQEEITFARKFIDAEKERLLGNYKEALVLFDQCLTINPKSDAVHFGIGKLFLEQELYSPAEQAFERAYGIDPTNKWYALSYAQVLLAQQKYKPAAKVYRTTIARYPSDIELRMDYANSLLFAGKEKQALKIFNEIEAETGPTHDIAQRKYDYFINAQKYNSAAQELEKLLLVYPDDTQLYSMLAELYKAQGKVNEAVAVYELAYKNDPTNPFYQLALAEFYDRAGKRDTAYVYLKRAFENDNMDIDRKVGVLLRLYTDAERNPTTMRQALDLCSAVISTHPTEAKSFSIYGDFLSLNNDKEGALEQFRTAADLDPSRFAIWSQILLIESELEKIELLAEDSERALELFPSQPSIYFFNGIANNQLERWSQAAKSLRIGAQMVIGNNQLSGQMLASLGDAYHELGNNVSSDSAYEAALDYDPSNSYVLNNYSYFLSLRGEKLDQAKEMIEKALQTNPNNPSYLDTYGWVLYQSGEYEAAEKELAQALLLGGASSVEVLEHYGDCMFRLSRPEEANMYWKRALDEGSQRPELLRKLETGTLDE